MNTSGGSDPPWLSSVGVDTRAPQISTSQGGPDLPKKAHRKDPTLSPLA
jgi:hypothetical protein